MKTLIYDNEIRFSIPCTILYSITSYQESTWWSRLYHAFANFIEGRLK